MVNFIHTTKNCSGILLFAFLLWDRGQRVIGVETFATTTTTSPTSPLTDQLNDNAFGGNLNITNEFGDNGQRTNASEERILRRGKRYLDFVKGSRMSARLILKSSILKVNSLWSYAVGVRMNYPFPSKEDRYVRPFFKRDVFHMVEDVMDGHGFDGRACILKTYCAAMHRNEGRDNGMLFRLLKMVFSLEAHEKRHMPYLNVENCDQLLYSHCPLEMDALTPYTDTWRLVVKQSILKVNSQWAYNYGIRTNYPIPTREDRRRPLFKRHLLDAIAGFLDGDEQSKFLFNMNTEDQKTCTT